MPVTLTRIRKHMSKVDLIYFNAGGGHRASALALEAGIAEAGLDWQVRKLNLFEIFDPDDLYRRITGMGPEDLYNQRLARGWTLGLRHELKVFQAMIRVAHPRLMRKLQQHWLRTEPDLVVSLVPNFNRALCQSLAATLPGVPYVTVMTDLADLPHNFWIERGQRQHFVCGTPRALTQALAKGHERDHVHRSSGMLLHPAFYRTQALDRARELRALGLDPQRPTGLVMFGGQGSRAMLSIAKRLADTQLILLCGHNRALAGRLRSLPSAAARCVVGFTPDVPYYMRLADFFIGKPGPGSISEAVQAGLPVIVADNAWTMPQERYNVEWVREHGIGLAIRSFRSVDRAVAQLLQDLDDYRQRVRKLDNRALFEVPAILNGILRESSLPGAALPHCAFGRKSALEADA